MGKGMDTTAASTDSGTGGPDKVPPNADPDDVGRTRPNPNDMDKTVASTNSGSEAPDKVPPNTDPDNVGNTRPNPNDMDKTAANMDSGAGGPDKVPHNIDNLEKEAHPDGVDPEHPKPDYFLKGN
jgi:hypothetical protein